MNKNDLRFQKTEQIIKSTYNDLKKKSYTLVKVKDLCDKAMINKTTFYSHYETMDLLHKQVCLDFISDMIKQYKPIENIQSNIKDFIYSVYDLFMKNQTTIARLYGEDTSSLVNDVEKVIMDLGMFKDMDEDLELITRFCIGGASRFLVYEKKTIRISKMIQLIENIFKSGKL